MVRGGSTRHQGTGGRSGGGIGLLGVLALAGCQLPRLGLAGLPTTGASSAGGLGQPTSSFQASASLVGQLLVPDPGLISNSGTDLVTGPTSELVSNNAAGLAQVGGAAFLRLQGLAQNPEGGIAIALENLAGTQVLAHTTTDASGSFQLPAPASAGLLAAYFTVGGQPYVYQTIVTPGQASATLDTASTIVSSGVVPLVAAGTVPVSDLAASFTSLVAAIGADLSPQTVPYMAAQSPDITAFLDQEIEDDATVSQAAHPFWVAGRLPPTSVAYPSVVRTVLTSGQAQADGIAAPDEPLLEDAGAFDVDTAGNLYLPTYGVSSSGATQSIQVVEMNLATGARSVYATLPPNIVSPVLLAFSPGGTLYAVGRDPVAQALVVCSGPQMQQVGLIAPIQTVPLTAGYRVAVDATGDVYLSRPYEDDVRWLPAGQPVGSVFAGVYATPGYLEGPRTQALFDHPAGLAVGPAGGLFIADRGNNCVRRIDPQGLSHTAVGAPGEAFYRNGRGAYARLDGPTDVTVGTDGSLYIADDTLRNVRRLSPHGSMFLVAGSGADAMTDGAGQAAAFGDPRFLTHDASGDLFLEDEATASDGTPFWAIREISPK